MSIQEKLDSIKVLFRAPEHLGLYGIPYEMRPGQSPGDLWRSTGYIDPYATNEHGQRMSGTRVVTPGAREDWVFLGYPGWWGHVSREEQDEIAAFLKPLEEADLVPGGPYEWSQIDRPLPMVENTGNVRWQKLASGLYGSPERDMISYRVYGMTLSDTDRGTPVLARKASEAIYIAREKMGLEPAHSVVFVSRNDHDVERVRENFDMDGRHVYVTHDSTQMSENPRRRDSSCVPGPPLEPNRLRGPAMKTTFGKDVDPNTARGRDIDMAMDMYEVFHAKRPLRLVELPPLPTKLVAVGEAQSTMYRTDKWHLDGKDEDYKHVHDKGERARYEFGEGVVVYEPAAEASKSTVGGRHVGRGKAVHFPVTRPDALSMLGYCLGFFVRRYDDEETYEVNPRGCYLFCSPYSKEIGRAFLAVFLPHGKRLADGEWLAIMAGGKLRVLKDGIDG